MFKFLESLIHGTRAHKAITPPAGLLSFYWHFIGQTPWFYVAMLVSSLSVVLVDISLPLFFGKMVEFMTAPDPAAELAAHSTVLWIMLLVVLIGRPLLQFADTALRLNALIPGATTLIRWQSHWHVVRQSWSFFQNDFSGRIANRVMQTAQSLRNSVMSAIRAVLYFFSWGILTLVLIFSFDWRLSVPTLIWLLGYVFFLRYFVPRLRDLAKQSSDANSIVIPTSRLSNCFLARKTKIPTCAMVWTNIRRLSPSICAWRLVSRSPCGCRMRCYWRAPQ
jgi:ATP-binding cassette subfamily B multidrug efflux pump